MAEIKLNYWYAALGIFITALVVGTSTYQLAPAGNYKVCDNGAGWTFNIDTGKYDCGSERSYDCSSVRNTKGGKPNYFCDEAIRILIEEKAIQSSCPAAVERVCPDFISYTDSGKTFCKRYSDGSEKCTEEYHY